MKYYLLLILCFAFSFLTNNKAQARKYNFDTTSISLSFNGGYALYRDSNYIANTFPASLGVTGAVTPPRFGYMFGGDLGYNYKRFMFYIGADYLYPNAKILKGTGTSAQGDFDINSKMTAIVYKGGIDFFSMFFTYFRVFFGLSGGMAYYTLQNDFNFSDTAINAGAVNFSDLGKTTGIYEEGHGGLEFFFVDNYSIGIKLGYKKANAIEFKYAKDSLNFGSPKASGATMLDADGNARSYDLSGPYGAIQMRLLY